MKNEKTSRQIGVRGILYVEEIAFTNGYRQKKSPQGGLQIVLHGLENRMPIKGRE